MKNILLSDRILELNKLLKNKPDKLIKNWSFCKDEKGK